MTPANIFTPKERLRPYHYPEFLEAYYATIQSHWTHFKIPMTKDISDWQDVGEQERNVIGGLQKGFTLAEFRVGCFWRNIADTIPHHEISMLANAFSGNEDIHAVSYDHMEAALGLDTYEAFKKDPICNQKIGQIISFLDNRENLPLSLAVFSGAVEGVSLFSSFAILLSFNKRGQFPGMTQILSYSANDEMNHSKWGINLYKTLIRECPELKPNDDDIYSGFDSVVKNEIAFVDQSFKYGDLETISKAEALDFVYYRANLKLMELGLKPCYELTNSFKPVRAYFDTIIKGKTMNDFFVQASNGTSYTSTVTQDFTNITYNV